MCLMSESKYITTSVIFVFWLGLMEMMKKANVQKVVEILRIIILMDPSGGVSSHIHNGALLQAWRRLGVSAEGDERSKREGKKCVFHKRKMPLLFFFFLAKIQRSKCSPPPIRGRLTETAVAGAVVDANDVRDQSADWITFFFSLSLSLLGLRNGRGGGRRAFAQLFFSSSYLLSDHYSTRKQA